MGLLASAAALLAATPAQAFLGIGEASENDSYTADTVRDCSLTECGVHLCSLQALAAMASILFFEATSNLTCVDEASQGDRGF